MTRSLYCKQSAEVGICGYDYALLVRRSGEDDLVCRKLELVIANMNRVMTLISKKLRKERG